MTEKQVGFVAMLAMVAILLTVGAKVGQGPQPNIGGFATTQLDSKVRSNMGFSCGDTDIDNTYSTGTVTIKYTNGAIGAAYSDTCSGDEVVEYYCGADGKATFFQVLCPKGCAIGACVK